MTTIAYGQNNQNAFLRGATILLGDDITQHITASGNVWISGSGNIYLNANGEITASGNISASGNILTSGNVTAVGTVDGNYILAKRPMVQLSSADDKTTNTDNTNSNGDINDSAAQLSWTVTDFSDTDYYSVSSSWGIGVKQTGRYRLSTHVNVLTGGARPGCMVQFYTGSAFGVAAAKVLPPEGWTYIRKPDSNAIKGNLNIDNYIVQLSSGSFVSVVAKNNAKYGGGAVVTWSGSLSYFNIEYLGA